MKLKSFIASLGKDIVTTYQYLQGLRLASLIITGVLLVRMGMHLDDLSTYEWVLFLVHAMSYFWTMGLKNAMLNFYPKLENSEQRDFFSSVLFLFLGLTVLTAGIAGLLTYAKILALNNYFWIVCFILLLNTVGGLVEHILLITERSRELFHFSSWSYILYPIIVVGAFITSGYDLDMVLWSIVLWGIFRLFWLVKIRDLRGGVNVKLITTFVAFSLPLIIHVLLGNGMEFVDGFLVKHYFADEEFAIFRYGARELPLNSILITSMVIALIPRAVNGLSETLAIAKSRLHKLLHWIMPLSIVLILTSKFLFQAVYSEDFIASAQIFNVYLLIIISRMWIPQLALYAHRDNTALMFITIVEITVNVVLSIILLKEYGLLGIAYATLIAYVLEKTLLSWYAWRSYGLTPQDYLPVKSYALYSVLLIIAYFITW